MAAYWCLRFIVNTVKLLVRFDFQASEKVWDLFGSYGFDIRWF